MSKETLLAGAGRADIIFPDALFPIEGFCGVHDAPMARVLLLRGGEQAAIVCLELVMLPPEGVEAVKEIVGRVTGTGHESIWVHTTHVISTPHAPHAPMGMGGVPLPLEVEGKKKLEFKTELYFSALEAAVTQASEMAVSALCEVRMGVGRGKISINVNRDIETPFGRWIGFAPCAPSNHSAAVLRFEDADGRAVAFFISCGLKPCAIDNAGMERGERLVSGDVCGSAFRFLEERLGAPCLFAMSAAGDQVPAEQARYDIVEPDGSIHTIDLGVEAGLEIAKRLGKQMAREAAAIIESIVCREGSNAVKTGKSFISWPGRSPTRAVLTKSMENIPSEERRIDVLAISIGGVALVGLKPELNTATEARLQSASPFEHTLLVSMVNGGQKYMPELEAFSNSTWEAQSSPMMPGAAEAWTQEALSLLGALHAKKERTADA